MSYLYRIFKENWIFLTSFLILLAFLYGKALDRYSQNSELLSSTPSSFFIEDIQTKNKTSLESLRGKKVLLYFFATWCGACRLQTPLINKIAHKMKDEKSFFLMAISDEDSSILQNYAQEKELNYSLFRDITGKAHDAFQIDSYPTVVLLNPNGTIKDIDYGLSLLLPFSISSWVQNSLW